MAVTRRQMLACSLSATAFAALPSAGGANESRGPGHVVLLGDSIFDNKFYVGDDDPAVVDQLRTHLPDGWRATLLAVDGDTAKDIATQLRGLPKDATHLVVSVGGNDALQAEPVLSRPTEDVAQGLLEMADVRDAFQAVYHDMIASVLKLGLPTTVCTIYDPNYKRADDQRVSVMALAGFNDVITRAAHGHGLPVLDLRVLFDAPEDYANPIEPSAVGGDKLARTIASVVAEHDFRGRRSVVYCRIQ